MKKVICFLMTGILVCQFMITNVLAAGELVDPDDVVTNGNEYFKNVFNVSDATFLPLSNDSVNKQFIVTYSDDTIFSYPYEDDYLEYESEDIPNTCADFNDIFYNTFSLTLIMAGAYNAAGCTDEQFYNIITWISDEKFNDYDKYGIFVEKKDFELKEDDSSCSGTYLTYLKMSFDKEKIQNAIKDFGNTENPNYGYDDFNEEFIPDISFGTISADYITIAANVFEIYDSDEIKKCSIYRSESENGEYTLIGTVACDGSNYLYDEDVVKGKKYFYKASVVGSNKLSEAYSATAVTAKSTPGDNPETGASIAYVLGSLFLVLIFATAIVFNRDKIEVK